MMSDEQIKYMVNRFLTWKLPENFNPDAGISFKADYNEHTAYPMKHEPDGTNLFDATQAEAMVRHMIDGMPAPDVERRIVEAAVWMRTVMRGHGDGDPQSAHDRLCQAVDAYLATQEPEGVRPADLRPGTRFKFVRGDYRHGKEGFCKLILAGPQRMWTADGKVAALFYDDDLLLPTPDTE